MSRLNRIGSSFCYIYLHQKLSHSSTNKQMMKQTLPFLKYRNEMFLKKT